MLPAALLLFQGVSRLQHERHGWSLLLAAAEVGVSVLVVGAFVRQVRTARGTHDVDQGDAHASHGVDWVDLLIGAMLGVEVWAHWHETGHIKRPTVLTAVGIFAVGLLHGKIAARAGRRLGLRIDDTGVAVGGRPFRNFRASWDELAAVEIEPRRRAWSARTARSRTFDFRDLRNAADVREALQGVKLRVPAIDAAADAAADASADSARGTAPGVAVACEAATRPPSIRRNWIAGCPHGRPPPARHADPAGADRGDQPVLAADQVLAVSAARPRHARRLSARRTTRR